MSTQAEVKDEMAIAFRTWLDAERDNVAFKCTRHEGARPNGDKVDVFTVTLEKLGGQAVVVRDQPLIVPANHDP